MNYNKFTFEDEKCMQMIAEDWNDVMNLTDRKEIKKTIKELNVWIVSSSELMEKAKIMNSDPFWLFFVTLMCGEHTNMILEGRENMVKYIEDYKQMVQYLENKLK